MAIPDGGLGRGRWLLVLLLQQLQLACTGGRVLESAASTNNPNSTSMQLGCPSRLQHSSASALPSAVPVSARGELGCSSCIAIAPDAVAPAAARKRGSARGEPAPAPSGAGRSPACGPQAGTAAGAAPRGWELAPRLGSAGLCGWPPSGAAHSSPPSPRCSTAEPMWLCSSWRWGSKTGCSSSCASAAPGRQLCAAGGSEAACSAGVGSRS